MKELEAAREAAVTAFVNRYHSRDETYPVIESAAVKEGFDAGIAYNADKVEPQRDYPEDWIADDDNGKYQRLCQICGSHFLGHKRRVSDCKVCHIKSLEEMAVLVNTGRHPSQQANAERVAELDRKSLLMPIYQIRAIQNGLRMTLNTFKGWGGTTAMDRELLRDYKYVTDALEGKEQK